MNIRNFYYVALMTAALVAFGACRKTQTTTQTTPATPAAPPDQYHTDVASTPVSQTKFFTGSIGDKLDLQMKLTRDGDQLIGSYSYKKVGSRIDLKGTIDKDGNVTLQEFDTSGKQTGMFKGIWKTDKDEGSSIAGNWSKPNSEKKTAFSLHEEPIAFTGGAEIVAKQIKETNKKLNYKVDVEYPQVTGALDNRFDKFNQQAKDLVTRAVLGFKKEMADNAKATEQTPEPSTLSELESDLSASYTIAVANDELISVRYEIGGYSAGAAHGNSSSHVLNYDLKGNKTLKLADLFKPGAKYLQTISDFCIKDLKRQSKKNADSLPDDMIQSGAGPAAKNFESWTLTKKGLDITFDAYQVGPYAAGPQKVVIPYAALKDLINPGGPAEKIATQLSN
jgi:Protein of unknown function (DUF3298)/Deacetylase PdaC